MRNHAEFLTLSPWDQSRNRRRNIRRNEYR